MQPEVIGAQAAMSFRRNALPLAIVVGLGVFNGWLPFVGPAVKDPFPPFNPFCPILKADLGTVNRLVCVWTGLKRSAEGTEPVPVEVNFLHEMAFSVYILES